MDRMHWNSRPLSRRYEHMKNDLLDRLRGVAPSMQEEAVDAIHDLGSRLVNALDMLVKIRDGCGMDDYDIHKELCDFLEQEGR